MKERNVQTTWENVFLILEFFASKLLEYLLKKKVEVLVTLLCPTLCDPMDCSLPGSSVHRILQARILE